MATFKCSRPAVIELASRYKHLVVQLKNNEHSSKPPQELEEVEKILYTDMCEICLLGNATDLSLLTSLTYEDIQKFQGSEVRENSEKNIIVNDLPTAYHALKNA